MEGNTQQKIATDLKTIRGFCDDIVCAYFIDHHTALFSC
jgi:hypothetical protein